MSAAFAKRSSRNSLIVVTCSAVLTIAACSKKEEAPEAPVAAMPSMAMEGQLDIVAWPGYIERGESDKAYDWVTKFEADTGCKVNVKVASTSDEMVTLMSSGRSEEHTSELQSQSNLVCRLLLEKKKQKKKK